MIIDMCKRYLGGIALVILLQATASCVDADRRLRPSMKSRMVHGLTSAVLIGGAYALQVGRSRSFAPAIACAAAGGGVLAGWAIKECYLSIRKRHSVAGCLELTGGFVGLVPWMGLGVPFWHRMTSVVIWGATLSTVIELP